MRFSAFVTFLCCVLVGFGQQAINPTIMGQNYWYADFHDPPASIPVVYSTNTAQANQDKQNVSGSRVRLQRLGGKGFNIGDRRPEPLLEIYYVSMVDDIRRSGCEPILTLPFLLDVNGDNPEPNVGDPNFTQKLENR